MPIVDVKVMEKVLTSEQKLELARGITDVFVKVVGPPVRQVTWVVIQDVASGAWTMAGEPVTTEGVKQLLGGEQAAVA